MSRTEKRVALVANAYLLERDALRVELDAMRQRAEAAEAANARCREANILLANSRNAAAEEWRQRAEAAEAAIDAMDDYLNYRDQSIAENCRPRSFIEWWRIRQMAQKVQP